MDILIKNVPVFGITEKKTNIVIENENISDIGLSASIPSPEYTISGKHLFITPALSNSHTHAPMSLLRGFSDNRTLMPWLQKIWSIESHFSAQDCRIGAELTFLEMIKSGTGLFCDFYFHEDEIIKAAKTSGLRSILGAASIEGGFLDLGGSEGMLKIAEKLLKEYENDDLISIATAPHAPHTCSEETIYKNLELTDKYNSIITIHLSETRDDVLNSQKQHGYPPIEWLDRKFDFFNNRKVLGAHCVWIQQREIDILAKNNVAVAFCPVSGKKLAYGGMLPVPELLQQSVIVCLGTDGPASNNTQDMVREMRAAATLISHQRWDPSLVKKKQILEMAALNLRSWMNDENFELKKGIPADLTIFNFKGPHCQPNINPVSSAVYSANGSDVESLIVNGKLLMFQRKVLTFDEERVIDQASECIQGLITKYGNKK